MGASVIPIVGSIITSVIVSKAVGVIGEKIGLSENLTGILSAAAGAYAGGAVYNQATTAAASGTAKVGMDLAEGTAMPTQSGATPPGTGLGGGGPVGQGGGGMLTQSGPPRPANANVPAAPPAAPPAPPAPPPPPADSWWSKMFTPGKTMDLVMAGMQGYGEAGMRQYEVDRPYEVEKDRGKRWEAMGTSGFNQVNPTYPSQGG